MALPRRPRGGRARFGKCGIDLAWVGIDLGGDVSMSDNTGPRGRLVASHMEHVRAKLFISTALLNRTYESVNRLEQQLLSTAPQAPVDRSR